MDLQTIWRQRSPANGMTQVAMLLVERRKEACVSALYLTEGGFHEAHGIRRQPFKFRGSQKCCQIKWNHPRRAGFDTLHLYIAKKSSHWMEPRSLLQLPM